MAKEALVGVDLGGTNILAAVVDRKGRILGESKCRTEPSLGAQGVTQRMAETVLSAIKASGMRRKNIGGVGVGVPGPVHPDDGTVVRCANLGSTWDGYGLRDALREMVGLRITVDNDVNVGALGEHTYGAGRNAKDMLAIFVGTGIGGGLILDGKLRSGFRNSAGEVGHMVILADGPLCGCGGKGHAEALASRTAIERNIREALASGRESIVPQLMGDAGHAIMSASIIGDAFDAGDEVTREAVQRAQYYLGVLISDCVNLLDPEVVVVGGGVLERMGDAYLEPVRSTAVEQFINRLDADKVRIVRAALGDYSGVIGAAILARERFGL